MKPDFDGANSSVGRVNILCVDDRPENLLALQAILDGTEYNLVLAESGAAALNAVLTHDFAVILMDVAMPDMDGFETATLIKQRPRCRNTPVIFITASIYDLEHIYRGYSVGAVDYLQKPIEPEVVRAKVSVFVELYQQREQIRSQAELLQQSERRERELLHIRAQAALGASEAQYEATVREAPFGMAIADKAGNWLRVNQRMHRMLGYEAGRLPPLSTLLHPAHRTHDSQSIERLWNREAPSYRTETRFNHKRGWPVWVNATFSRLVDGSNATERVAVVVEDITERKWREQWQEFLAQASEVLLSSLDYNQTLTAVAKLVVPTLADWCSIDLKVRGGPTRQLALVHRDASRLPKLTAFRKALCWDKAQDTPSVPTAESHLLQSLDAVPEYARSEAVAVGLKSAMSVPIAARGEVLGRICVGTEQHGRSFTDRDVAAAEDFAHRCAFAVENARLYEEAQSAVHARDEFLSVASHELRTPLTPLRIQLQRLIGTRLRPPMANVTPERLREILQRSERHVQRLGALIDNLLDVSRITSGRLSIDPEPLDLSELVTEVVGRFREEASHTGSTVTLHCAQKLNGRWDRLRMEQVVTNLLTNAVKYGRGKPIDVHVSERNGRASIEVHDHGIGIPKDKQEHIFARFERAVPSRAYGGLGLGLFITRQILDAHKGSIRVESEPEQGAIFAVDLPMQTAMACAQGEDEGLDAQNAESSDAVAAAEGPVSTPASGVN